MTALPTSSTIATILDGALDELGLPRQGSYIGSTNQTARQFIAFAQRTGDDLVSRVSWPQLQKEYTITLVTSQSTYALPDDFDLAFARTFWDRSQQWELVGPLTPQEWQWLQSGAVTSFPRKRFRIQGFADQQFNVEPTPTASENGNILVLEYQTKTWIRPAEWATSTVYAAGAYTFYNGNIYTTTAGGTSGATPPTHTSGSASDGGVSWIYSDAAYYKFLADTDVPLMDEDLINIGVQWRWLRKNGQDYIDLRNDYERLLRRQVNVLDPGRTLDLTRRSTNRFLSSLNIPDTGFGS